MLQGRATLMTADASTEEVRNFLQLSASLEEVRIVQAEAAAKKQQEKAATQREKDETREQKAAERTTAVAEAMVAVLAKLHVDSVDSIRDYSLLQKLTGAELDVVHKFKLGKGAKGNVADKRAAVAVALGVDVPPVGDAPDC
jgi:hypothetical protein